MGEDYINSIFNYPESKPQDQEEDEEEAEDVLLILSDGTTIIGIQNEKYSAAKIIMKGGQIDGFSNV